MEKISNFKTFSKKSADDTAVKIGEENDVKRSEIAEKVKSVLSDMDISSLNDLTEDQKDEFMNNLFTSEKIDDVEEDRAEDIEDEEVALGEPKALESKEVSEGEIASDGAFKKYAENLLKKAFGDDFDAEKAEDVITGLIKKYDDYGAMIGAIQSSLSK